MSLKALDAILSDSNVNEVMWNHYDSVFVEMGGGLQPIPSPFQSAAEFSKLIEHLAKMTNTIQGHGMFMDGILPDGSRFHVTLPPLSPDGPTLTIRKFSVKYRGISHLVSTGFMTAKLATFLDACVRGKMNIIISGATGAGKTTLLNALVSLVDQKERIITIEDIPEIQVSHPNWVRLLAVRDQSSVTVRECLIGCLRMRPDRIIVGECRSRETLDMLEAMNTGHEGGMTTVHANSTADAFTRLESLILFHAGADIPMRALRRQISDAIDLVIQVKKGAGGQRYIEEVLEVVGMEGDMITRLPLFKTTDRKKDMMRVLSTGHPPTFLSRLESRGVTLPKGFFDPQTFEPAA